MDDLALGGDGPKFANGYGAMLKICQERLTALETEYQSIAKTTNGWRTALLSIGAASGLFTAGYAVFEKNPDQRVVGLAGLFSTASLTGSFGFLTESERLNQLDADAAEISKKLGEISGAADALEAAGRAWSRQASLEACTSNAKACEETCSGTCLWDAKCLGVCGTGCEDVSRQCVKSFEDANLAFQEARSKFAVALRRGEEQCSVHR